MALTWPPLAAASYKGRRLGVVAARAPPQFVGQAELVLHPRDVLALGPRDEEPFEAFHVFGVRRPQRRAAGGAGAPAALFQLAVGVRGRRGARAGVCTRLRFLAVISRVDGVATDAGS